MLDFIVYLGLNNLEILAWFSITVVFNFNFVSLCRQVMETGIAV